MEEQIDFRFGVRGGYEGDFETAGRGVEPVVEHVVKIGRMRFLIAGF
jgi:hypothetical protein